MVNIRPSLNNSIYTTFGGLKRKKSTRNKLILKCLTVLTSIEINIDYFEILLPDLDVKVVEIPVEVAV